MGLNTSLSFATLSDGFTINKKVFPTHPLGAFQGEPGRAYILSQSLSTLLPPQLFKRRGNGDLGSQ